MQNKMKIIKNILWIISITLVSSPPSTSEIIRLNNGVLFRRILSENTFYSQAIPIIFTEKIPAAASEFRTRLRSAFHNGTFTEKDWQHHVQKNVLNMFENEWFTTLNDTQSISLHTREKRGIQFLGEIYQWCCNTALLSDLEDINANQREFASQYNNLKNVVIKEHENLLNFNIALEGIKNSTYKEFKEIQGLVQGVELQADAKNLLSTQLFLYIIHLKEIIQKCEQRRLSSNAVKTETLYETLAKLEESLNSHGLHLAIPLSDIKKYYTAPITHCQMVGDEMTYSIKVPIHSKNQNYKLYEPIPLAYQNFNELCQLQIEKSLLLYHQETEEIQIVSGHALTNCRTQDRLCKIEHLVWDRNAACLAALYRKSSVSDLTAYCAFSCTQQDTKMQTLPKIFHVNYREYVIPNPTRNTYILYPNNTKVNLREQGLNVGATYIKIECDVRIVEQIHDNPVVLVDKTVPCFKAPEKFATKIIRILPAQWTHIPPSEIGHGLETIHNYDSNYPLFNEQWKRSVPTIHLKTVAEYEDELQNITLQVTTNTLLGSRFYTDILYLALFGVNFLLLFILYCIVVLKSHPNSMPQIFSMFDFRKKNDETDWESGQRKGESWDKDQTKKDEIDWIAESWGKVPKKKDEIDWKGESWDKVQKMNDETDWKGESWDKAQKKNDETDREREQRKEERWDEEEEEEEEESWDDEEEEEESWE